jgi:hypothetical protein
MTTPLKKYLQQLADNKAPGPSTSFSVFHVFYALELMAQEPLGRNKLAKKLGVGDGAVRTIISRLKDAELLDISKMGCTLTPKGTLLWQQIQGLFPKRVDVPQSELTTSDYNHAFLVKGAAGKVESVIDQRDAAIIAGARKALVVVQKKGRLGIESVSENIEKVYPKATQQIKSLLMPMDNDVVVIASADSALKAKQGAFAASWTLVCV